MGLGTLRRLTGACTLVTMIGCGDAPRGAPATPATPAANATNAATPATPSMATSRGDSAASPAAAAVVAESGYGAREVARRRCTEGQRIFWAAFRAAALGDSVDAVVARTHFPFAVRGMLDDDPVRRLDRARFRREWPALLAADPRTLGDTGTGDTAATSMRALLARHAEPRDPWCTAPGQMNVGTFVFLADGDDDTRLRLHEAVAADP